MLPDTPAAILPSVATSDAQHLVPQTDLRSDDATHSPISFREKLKLLVDDADSESLGMTLRGSFWDFWSNFLATIGWMIPYYFNKYFKKIGTPGYFLLSVAEGIFSMLIIFPFVKKSYEVSGDTAAEASEHMKKSLCVNFPLALLYQTIYDINVWVGNLPKKNEFTQDATPSFEPLEVASAFLTFCLLYGALHYAGCRYWQTEVSAWKSWKESASYFIFYLTDDWSDTGEFLLTLKPNNIRDLTLYSALPIGAFDFVLTVGLELTRITIRKSLEEKKDAAPGRNTNAIVASLSQGDIEDPLLTQPQKVYNSASINEDNNVMPRHKRTCGDIVKNCLYSIGLWCNRNKVTSLQINSDNQHAERKSNDI